MCVCVCVCVCIYIYIYIYIYMNAYLSICIYEFALSSHCKFMFIKPHREILLIYVNEKSMYRWQ